MENSDFIWQWCGVCKKLFRMKKFQSMADGFSPLPKIGSTADRSSPNINCKGKQYIHHCSLRRSSTTFQGNPLKSRADCRDMCSPVQNSIAEVGHSENGNLTKSPLCQISGISLDTISDHPDGNYRPDAQCLRQPLGIAEENSVGAPAFYAKQRPLESRAARRGQKPALKRNRLFSDERMKGSSGQHAACNREPSVEVSSSCSVSMLLAEDIELKPLNMNGEMKDLRVVATCSSNYINSPCHPPSTKKPKGNQNLVSESDQSLFQIDNKKAKSEILFPELHLLADAAVQLLENGEAAFLQNSLTEEKGIRKAIDIPSGAPFLQKKVPRIAKSKFKYQQPYAWPMHHNIQKNLLGAANSKPFLMADNNSKLGDRACIKQSENQVMDNGVDEVPMVIPHARCSKRTRPRALPAKYSDSVLQPW